MGEQLLEQPVHVGVMTYQWLRTCRARCPIARSWRRLACVFGFVGAVSMPFHAQSRWFGQPAEHLPPQHLPAFEMGRTLFQRVFTASTGLGPEFNAVSCASCHDTPVVGGSGRTKDTLVPWIYSDDSDGLGAPGQRFAIATDGTHLQVPLHSTERRRAPPLFGLGYLEAIPIETVRSRHDPFDADGDGISGRLPWREDCFGRFGWQSTICDVEAFVIGALNHELGIVLFPRRQREVSRGDVADLMAFVRGLAPPPPPESHDGADLFERVRCAECHTPVTGVASVASKQIEVGAYTDLLLHEMGNGRREGEQDSRSEFRTPALWGIAATGPPYLHNGSAATLEQAILRHAGEAERSRRLFSTLTRAEKHQLMRFVSSR